jgi:hypothetical protein
MNKSAVCKIANKMTAAGMNRRTAFGLAWIWAKQGGLEVKVSGVSFGNRQEALRRLARYNPSEVKALLVPEPENPADPRAVAVMVGVQGGKGLFKLSYVASRLAPVAAALSGKLPALNILSGGNILGARLALAI